MVLRIHGEPTGPFQENTYVVVDEASGKAAVVDPGLGALDIWRAQAADGIELDRVLLTHAHLDHVFGLRELLDAVPVPVHLHEDDRFLIEEYVPIAAQWGFEVESAPMPDHWWKHADELALGETVFEIRHTPGHSPGSVALCFDGGVFVGDTIMGYSVGRTDFPRSSHDALVESIRSQLYTLPDETTVYPGHMTPTTIGEEKRHNQFVRAE